MVLTIGLIRAQSAITQAVGSRMIDELCLSLARKRFSNTMPSARTKTRASRKYDINYQF